jgi:hypothetical protein
MSKMHEGLELARTAKLREITSVRREESPKGGGWRTEGLETGAVAMDKNHFTYMTFSLV